MGIFIKFRINEAAHSPVTMTFSFRQDWEGMLTYCSCLLPFSHALLLVPFSGQTKRRGSHSVSRQEKMFWRVQVSIVQTEVDERKQLGKHRATVHQVLHQRISAQAETAGQT